MTNQSSRSTAHIAGKVAAILNARELAINIGAKSGVTIGMKFKVLAEAPISVADPDTGADLGVIDREKVRIRAIEVQENLTVCKTYQTRVVGGGVLYPGRLLEDLSSPPREIVDTLKVNSGSFPPPLSEQQSYVKRGDRVVQLSKAELETE